MDFIRVSSQYSLLTTLVSLPPPPSAIKYQHASFLEEPSWPLTAPGTAKDECTSVKKPAGFFSMASTLKPAPVSTPLANTPVVKGPVIQPLLFRRPLLMSTGLGNAILGGLSVSVATEQWGKNNSGEQNHLGGPFSPFAAWWICVAVLAGDWYSPRNPLSVMS